MTNPSSTFALLVASNMALYWMDKARAAKANNRPEVASHYVRQARAEIRRGRRGEYGNVRSFIMGTR